MKKTILVFLLGGIFALFPLACSYQSVPYRPAYHPYATPTANPTYAVPAPAYKTSWGTAGGPNALALGMGTTVYVAEADGTVSLVEVFDSGNPSAPLAQWTAYGSVPLAWPAGVAFNASNGNVYVTDNLNNAVYEFTAGGATVASWTGYGSQPFGGPEGIVADASGNLYVADTGNNVVEEFTAAGSPLHRWDGTTSIPFFQPSAVALDSSGNVEVADAGDELIDLFTAGGVTSLGHWSTVPNADIFGIAVDSGGNVYAADYGDGTPNNGNGLLEEYDPNGHLMAVWGSSAGTSAFGPDGVALSGSDVLVADWNNNLIQVFGP